MAWIPRPLGPNLCYHVRVQCNNRAFRFQTTEDFERYLAIVFETKTKHAFLFHHFALMHTHVHLILTTPGPVLLDRIMHRINRHYSLDYHRRYQRSGHFWMNGYRCAVIDSDRYALTCMRYVDRNAPRAGIVAKPEEWPWCAYSFYGYGSPNIPLDPHPSYIGIAEEPGARQIWYREFVSALLPCDESREKETICSALRPYNRKPRTPKM